MHALISVVMSLVMSPAAAIDFDSDVVPILTKAGCNAAACHGSALGRGGFKLSLFGGNPALDHAEIVHRIEGRRVNLAQPAASLLIVKPTMQLDHEGGLRFDFDGPEAATLLKWIEQGARRLQARKLVRLEVAPRETVLPRTEGQFQIQAAAVFDDGARRDVTATSVYRANDPAAVSVGPNGKCRVLRRGRHAVVVRYMTQVTTVQVTVPLGDAAVDLADLPRRNWIDEEVVRTLEMLRLPVSPPTDDATWLRRLRLDLTGRLPSPREVRRYTTSRRPDKQQVLVDSLLASNEFAEYWAYKLAKLLRVRAQPNEPRGARAFHGWIREQLRGPARWDQMAAELLRAEGDTYEYGPANFYRVVGDARAQAEYASELLLGARLRCANCHNHPLDHWTQDDYHGLAAIFARIERGRQVRVRDRGEVIHPRTGGAAVPRIPGNRFLDPAVDGRRQLANWLSERDNPYFAKAMVNRLWKAMLGRGLIEPTDDLRATNPATHPSLLARLAADFVSHDYDLRHTIRLIALSSTYQRDSQPNAVNRVDDRFFSHALPRRLEPEVLADAICDVTGVAGNYGPQPPGTRAVALFDPNIKSAALDILGRCERQDSCETNDAAASGLTTQLHLINGPLINQRLIDKSGRLAVLIEQGSTTAQIVEEFYWVALSRPPTNQEAEYWQTQLLAAGANRTAPLEDFVWSLLNSHQFLTK